uniref:Inner centromere protein ARK-binding domain-containing protein n=1 Tax=Setaria digitata TaxID=48799 RepID=A0A915PU88_9BILA
MYNLRSKKIDINCEIVNKIDAVQENARIPSNLWKIFEKITEEVINRIITPDLNQRIINYQQWIIDEQKKVEEILIDRRVHFGLNLSQYQEMTLSASSFDDFSNLDSLSTWIAKGVRNYCAGRTANAISKKKQMLEAVAEKTRRFREDRLCQVKQRKKQLEKEDEQRRKQSMNKIKLQAVNAATNRERKLRELSGTSKRTRTANDHTSTPIAKRLRSKKMVPYNSSLCDNSGVRMGTVSLSDDNSEVKMKRLSLSGANSEVKMETMLLSDHNGETVHNSYQKTLSQEIQQNLHTEAFHNEMANEPALISSKIRMKSNIITESHLKLATSQVSNMEVTSLSESDSNCAEAKPKTSLDAITAIAMLAEPSVKNVEISLQSNNDANTVNADNENSLSASLATVSTASVLERTRPCNVGFKANKRSTYVINGDVAAESDRMMCGGKMKRSTYTMPKRMKHLKYESTMIGDDFRVLPMDMKSSTHKSKLTVAQTDTDMMKVSVNVAKRGKVTSTRFPGRVTLEKLEGQEYIERSMQKSNEIPLNSVNEENGATILPLANIQEMIDEDQTDYGINDLSSNDRTDPSENPRKKVPYWAEDSEVQKFLVKQQKWSPADVDALFGKIHPPDMQKIFNGKIRVATRSSSAMWESPIWNPRVGYSAYHLQLQQNHNQEYRSSRRFQREKKHSSYVTYF